MHVGASRPRSTGRPAPSTVALPTSHALWEEVRVFAARRRACVIPGRRALGGSPVDGQAALDPPPILRQLEVTSIRKP